MQKITKQMGAKLIEELVSIPIFIFFDFEAIGFCGKCRARAIFSTLYTALCNRTTNATACGHTWVHSRLVFIQGWFKFTEKLAASSQTTNC